MDLLVTRTFKQHMPSEAQLEQGIMLVEEAVMPVARLIPSSNVFVTHDPYLLDVAQHALALKVADTACGRVDAVLAAASVPVGSQDALTALYRRLGELDYEREVILGMIRDRLAKQHDEGAH